jgi:hypothetical protein
VLTVKSTPVLNPPDPPPPLLLPPPPPPATTRYSTVLLSGVAFNTVKVPDEVKVCA